MESQPNSIHSPCSQRPTRDFLLQLPQLHVNSDYDIDYAGSDPAVLLQIASNAEIIQQTIYRGLSSVGYFLTHIAPEIEHGEIPGDFIEALGFLMMELGDVASIAHCLAVACRRHTADYEPVTPVQVKNVSL